MFSTFFFLNSCRLWNNVEKYCKAGRPTDGKMTHAHCVLETKGYIHTLRICNTYWFSTTTMVARTRLSVTLYVNILACVFVFFVRVRKIVMSVFLSARVCVCVCVCVCVGGGVFRMEQLGSQWTNSHGIWYLSIFRKSVGKLKVSLKRDKNNGYITCRAIYIYDLLA